MSGSRRKKIATEGGEGLGVTPFDGLAGFDCGDEPGRRSDSKGERDAKGEEAGQVRAKGERLEVRREKAGRGGKTVTTIRGFPAYLGAEALGRLGYDLKQTCACGGTVKERVVELQGDVRERACSELERRGFRPVRSGG